MKLHPIEQLSRELRSQVLQTTWNFSLLDKLSKQVESYSSQIEQACLTQGNPIVNSNSSFRSKFPSDVLLGCAQHLLDTYFLVEEQQELAQKSFSVSSPEAPSSSPSRNNHNKIPESTSAQKLDPTTSAFSLKLGASALMLLNTCFYDQLANPTHLPLKQSPEEFDKEMSNPFAQQFSKQTLEDLLLANTMFVQKYLSHLQQHTLEPENKSAQVSHSKRNLLSLSQLSHFTDTNEIIISLLSDIDSDSDNSDFQSIKLCNALNNLELKSLFNNDEQQQQQVPFPFQNLLEVANNILRTFNSSIDAELIEYVLRILFSKITECNIMQMQEFLVFYDSIDDVRSIELNVNYSIHILKFRILNAFHEKDIISFDSFVKSYSHLVATNQSHFDSFGIILIFKSLQLQMQGDYSSPSEDTRLIIKVFLSEFEVSLVKFVQAPIPNRIEIIGDILQEMSQVESRIFYVILYSFHRLIPSLKQLSEEKIHSKSPVRAAKKSVSTKQTQLPHSQHFQNELEQYQPINAFTSILEMFLSRDNSSKYLIEEQCLGALRDCVKTLIMSEMKAKKNSNQSSSSMMKSHSAWNSSNINSSSYSLESSATAQLKGVLCRVFLQVTMHLPQIDRQSILPCLEMIEIFLVFLRKEASQSLSSTSSSTIILIDEVACLGLLCALKSEDSNLIRTYSSQISDSLGLLPELLRIQVNAIEDASAEISPQQFNRLMMNLFNLSSSCATQNGGISKQQSSHLLHVFAFRNLLETIDNYPMLLDFYAQFTLSQFDAYLKFLTETFKTSSDSNKPSLCSPLIKKLRAVNSQFRRKQQSSQHSFVESLPKIQEIIKHIFVFLEKFYEFYTQKDIQVDSRFFCETQEREELIALLHGFAMEEEACFDPRISCKFLHQIVLINSLDLVFDNQSFEYCEQSYMNECVYRMRIALGVETENLNQTSKVSSKQYELLINPLFLRGIILLFAFQVSFYELALQNCSSRNSLSNTNAEIKVEQERNVNESNQLNQIGNLVEDYLQIATYLINYQVQLGKEGIPERELVQQFMLFKFVYGVLRNDISTCLSAVDSYTRENIPESIPLLAQIAKSYNRKDLLSIIAKKYVYLISSTDFVSSSSFSYEVVIDMIDCLSNQQELEGCFFMLRKILDKIEEVESKARDESEIENVGVNVNLILNRMKEKITEINSNHPLNQVVNDLLLRSKIKY